MSVAITISKKTIVFAFAAILLLILAGRAYSSHDAGYVHVCIKNNGNIRVVNQNSDCNSNEVHNSLATEDTVIALAARVTQLETDLAAETAARIQADIDLQVNIDSEAAARAQTDAGLQSQIDALQTNAAFISDLMNFLSIDGNEIYITGANLHVRNGTGTTDGNPNGLGNLTIGYNRLRTDGLIDDRSGSHMLVVGDENNYSGFGGIVAGSRHEALGDYASISGGHLNTVTAKYASVSGGVGNRASGKGSSVSGGNSNGANGQYSSVSGGSFRSVDGVVDWAAGGLFEDS